VRTVQSELARIATKIYGQDFRGARNELIRLDKEFPSNADINNLLGYTARKLKLYTVSAFHYKKALEIDPGHLDALEYQGELFVLTRKFSEARKNLSKLEKLCGVACPQFQDLKKAIGNKR
jgi:tetratricopeptide (TPR) repeat protein